MSSEVVVEGIAHLDDERLLHLRKVLRSKPGDSLRAGLVNGKVGTATVLAINKKGAQLAVSLNQSPPEPMAVDLLLALPRPKFLGRVLQHTTTFGVKNIVLFQSARVEKSYWSSNLLANEALHRHLLLGLEQGRDTVLPKITVLRTFRELLDTVEKTAAERTVLVADGNADKEFPRKASGPTALVIGPEGGFLRHEVDDLAKAGGHVTSLGNRPLRVETAVAACLSRLLPIRSETVGHLPGEWLPGPK